jgi:hypothetical protein
VSSVKVYAIGPKHRLRVLEGAEVRGEIVIRQQVFSAPRTTLRYDGDGKLKSGGSVSFGLTLEDAVQNYQDMHERIIADCYRHIDESQDLMDWVTDITEESFE